MSIHISPKSQSATVDGMALAFADKHTNIRYSVTGKKFWVKYPHDQIPIHSIRMLLVQADGEWIRDESNTVAGMMRVFAREYADSHPDVQPRVILNSQFINGAISLLKSDPRVAVGTIQEVMS
jgi:hypothetical protein